ncbi:MAG: hypothetical protein BroJett011_46730 [Chloroflexota bacterium]|nr:MAG: hypothetical protein BroJett011_46730 [Chloroflexota bacterium]
MSQQNQIAKVLSRRDALKALAATTGAAALSSVPDQWQKPVVKVGALPAFAQVSPLTYPFSNRVDVRIEQGGAALAGATSFEDQGWVGVYIPDPNAPIKGQDDKGRPWRRLRRRRVGPPSWAPGPITVIITLTFFPVDILEPNHIPQGNIFCYGYGLTGGTAFNGLLEGNIANGTVVFIFTMPVAFFGFFFFSCFFPTIIFLQNGDELDSSFYFGPCLYGPNSPPAEDDDQDDIDVDGDDDDTDNDPDTIKLGAFAITFKGVTYAGNQSTWNYRVKELSTPPELSEWVLGLPLLDCGTLVSSTPGGTEVTPDPDSSIIGIEWQVAPGFTAGDFSVTLSGDVVSGLVGVAVKGDNNVVGISQIVGPICQDAVDDVTLANCYRVVFLGATDNGNGTSTWRYYVEELPCAQDLSNWVLALPLSCVDVITASPEPWEVVTPDPNAQLNGIKWQTGAGFQQGNFEVVLQGTLGVDLGVGIVDVAAKGPDVEFGQINGPVCL